MTRRQKAILKRNLFLTVCALVLIGIITLVGCIAFGGEENEDDTSETSSPISSVDSSAELSSETKSVVSSEPSSNPSSTPSKNSSKNETTTKEPTTVKLDPEFENLMLVNGWNPLPEDFDYEGHLTTIPKKYIKGSLTQIDKDVWPYLKAMLDDAKAEGIDIGVWSPYRSYATQKWLFEKQVKKQINNGVPKDQAEDKAATIVARPGTSEHNTGLALDINCADHSFKNTKAYKWLCENAEDYGFVMRYAEEKQEKTGVIYESWHWRFVGINAAHEMNDLGMCLEEYVEYKNK